MYKAVILDLGNVLLKFDYQIIIDSINNIDPGLGDEFAQRYYNNYHLHEQLEKDEISVEDFTKIILKWLNYKISANEFYHIYSDMFTANKEVIELLPRLKNNYKLFLLSNTNYIHQKYGWQQYEFLKNFDKLLLSQELKARKPEQEIFKKAEKIIGFDPAEIFFIDDVAEYAEAAKLWGWDAVQFTGIDDLLVELGKRKIL